jgi:hypothetical protein
MPTGDTRLSAWWPRLALLALLAGLALGALLPVYSDEVVWRLSERAALDGFDKLSSDLCGPNTLAVPPWFMWPVRHYSAWFNLRFAAPGWVRASGVLYALAQVALWWRLIGQIAGERARTARALFFGLAGLGVMPLLLLLSRPEQPLLLCLTLALLLAGPGWRGGKAQAVEAVTLRSLAIVMLGAVALSYHMKAMVLVPALGLAILTCGRGRGTLAVRLGAIAALGAMAIVAAQYWVARFSCPGDPAMARNLASQNVSALLAHGRGVLVAIAALFLNTNFDRYVWILAPAVKPMGGWLPAVATPAGQLLWQIGLCAVWGLTSLAGLAAAWRGARAARAARRLEPDLAMALLLLALPLGWGMSQTAKNVYDAGFVLPLWTLGLLLALAHAAPGRSLLVRGLAKGLPLAAVLSVMALALVYGPAFWRAQAPRAELPGQPISVPLRGYSATRAEALAVARQCGIDPARHQPHALLVDESSYFTFMGGTRPQFHLGVVGVWKGGITDPLAYLRSVGSDGAVLACRNLPPALQARAHRLGQTCCLGPL